MRRSPVILTTSFRLPTWLVFLPLILSTSVTNAVADESTEPINYDDHVSAILKRHCLQCHGESKQEAGLNFSNFASATSEDLVVAGRSSASRLFEVITAENPDERMPPENDPLPKEQITLIKTWIDTGLRENSGSSVAAKRMVEFKPTSMEDVEGDASPMPEGLPKIEATPTIRPFPVLAMAASPRAPLLAVGSYERIDFVSIDGEDLIGSVAFPEGEPYVLRFSLSGGVLMAAGGRPVQNGVAVLYDVKTGRRLAKMGDETDVVIAADVSADERRVAIGGSGRVVKIYSTQTGALLHTLVKHTDWVTSIAFSPDGKLLASGDRVGNIHLWDAEKGGVVQPLAEHKDSITALSWRSDSQILASGGEDGLIVWWDVARGWPLHSKANAHPPKRPPGSYGTIPNGVLDVSFGQAGELVSCGRDETTRLWASNSKELKSFANHSETAPANIQVLPLQTALSSDGDVIITGDSAGKLHFHKAGTN